MANNDFRQVIIDHLSTPAIPISHKDAGGGWHAVTSRGGMRALVETIQFGKRRTISGKMVQFVTFEDMQGRQLHYTCYLTQNDGGEWRFVGGAGGSGRQTVVREHPWVNLGGGGWPDHFYAGGYVADNGLDIAYVRLIADNGTVIEDTIEDGIVLFITASRVEMPLQAELYDQENRLVASHSVFR